MEFDSYLFQNDDDFFQNFIFGDVSQSMDPGPIQNKDAEHEQQPNVQNENVEAGEENINKDNDIHEQCNVGDEDDEIMEDVNDDHRENGLERLEFVTVAEAREYYKDYAHSTGFGIRTRWKRLYDTRNKKSSVVHYAQFVCNKEGEKVEPPPEEDNRKGKRSVQRTDCKAHFRIKLNSMKTAYILTSWNKDHNHDLHPPEFAHLIRSNRCVNEVQGLVATMNANAGIGLRSSYELMSLASGGNESLGFQPMDLKNHLGRKRQKDMLLPGEATAMAEYFREKARMDASFFHEMAVDSEEMVTNFFWADGRMRMDYSCFGDAITFDTTFRTNKNYRPLALFVGFNHHRQICILGAALLYDQSAASFEWLFRSFMRCMFDKAPKTIFTDQDKGMAKAIKSVLPGTFHGLCTWHLLQNGINKMGTELAKKCDLDTLMYVVSTEEEFEYVWRQMERNCFPNRDVHPWLKNALKLKEKWSSPWLKQNFTAGMWSTQLSESTNAVLRGYLQADHNILQFFTHFERVVASRRTAEKEQDFRSADKFPNNSFPFSPIVKSAAEHYTHKMFAKFHEEYQHTLQYVVERVPTMDMGEVEAYRCFMLDSVSNSPSDVRIVYVRVENITLACCCRLYETLGIFCRHILTLMDFLRVAGNTQMRSLPPHYIMKRWTKKAKSGVQLTDTVGTASSQSTEYVHAQRYQQLCAMMVHLARSVCTDANLYNIAEGKFKELCSHMQQLSQSRGTHDASQNDQTIPTTPQPSVLRFKPRDNPRGSRKRWKTISEQKRTAKRTKFQCEMNRGNLPSDGLNEEDIQLTL